MILHTDNAVRNLKAVCPMWEFSSKTAHSWRHTIAVHMIEAGLSIVVIKNFLGHSSIVTTQIYAELTQASVDKKIKEWNEKWFSPDVKTESKNEQKLLLDFLTP